MRLGIFGGSFNPVHQGHVALARAALAQLALDRLLVVPARQSPHKPEPPEIPDDLRFELVRLAFAPMPEISVVDWELRRSGVSYTVDTLAGAAAAFPGAEMWLIMGADAFLDFPKWRDVPRILAAASLAVTGRPVLPPAELADTAARLPGLRWRMLAMSEDPVSSTTVRARARAGESLAGLVPDPVRARIEREWLYRARPRAR